MQAQAVCRDIARDPDYQLAKGVAQNTIEQFEKALQSLEIL